MRKKAEKKIREAAAMLGEDNNYRLDKVRTIAGLFPKVYDKTILDMARLGTITLTEGKTDGLSPAEIGNMVRKGETVYMYFSFQEEIGERPVEAETGERPAEPETVENPEEAETGMKAPETVDVILSNVDRAVWQQFEKLSLEREGKPPLLKIVEMIVAYNRTGET